TWAWGPESFPRPTIAPGPGGPGWRSLHAHGAAPLRNLLRSYDLGPYLLAGPDTGELLFTDNETHAERVFGGCAPSRSPYVKDAFHRHVINGEACVNPQQRGTKACFHFADVSVPAGGAVVFRLRLAPQLSADPLADVDAVVARRREEADEFYAGVH